MNAAGIRNAIFDSIFFGCRAFLSNWDASLSSAVVFAVSAIVAASCDYTVDVTVKRMMLIPPQHSTEGFLRTFIKLIKRERFLSLHKGLGMKARYISVIVYPCEILITVSLFSTRQSKWE